MRNRNGFSLVELLTVAVIVALIIALVTAAVIKEIDRARGSTLINEARMVYNIACAVIFEQQAADGKISDYDYMEGLTGTVDDASRPVETMLSRRMNTLLLLSVVLAKEPAEGVGKAVFVVKNGVIVSVSYESAIGSRLFTVTIADRETTIERSDRNVRGD